MRRWVGRIGGVLALLERKTAPTAPNYGGQR